MNSQSILFVYLLHEALCVAVYAAKRIRQRNLMLATNLVRIVYFLSTPLDSSVGSNQNDERSASWIFDLKGLCVEGFF